MPLKDFYCTGCGTVSADHMVALDCSSIDQPCPRCRAATRHEVVCNTRGPRIRVNDWPSDPRFYRGQVETGGFRATYIDDKTKEEVELGHCHRPAAMTADPYFSDDSTAERRDRLHHDTDRERGTLPLIFGPTAGQTAGATG